MTKTSAELALKRILNVLEGDLIDAPEDEIAAVLKDLGMTMAMKGSVALADMKYPRIGHGKGAPHPGSPIERNSEPDNGAKPAGNARPDMRHYRNH